MMGAMQQPQAERVFGRYALFDEIAAGGMATVHLGRLLGPVGFSKTVAIKRLHPHLARDPEFVSMFLDEARLAARIHHPNVVSTLDVVAIEGEVFLVLDYVQGESFSRLLKATRARQLRVDPRVVGSVVVNTLHGLHAAHEASDEHGHPLGIVHRDISPQNVIVGTDGVARVLDFGVAKAAGRLQSTRDGQLKGKLAYMAPEQVRGDPVDRRTDIYSAAVVLWEGLVGRRLVQGSNEGQVLAAVLAGGFPAPSALVSGLPPGIDQVVMRALDPSIERRFATAREMAIAVERALGVASPYEVGEWVQAVAQDALAMRAARVREMESTSAVHMVPASNAAVAGPGPGGPPPLPPRNPHEYSQSGVSWITSPSLVTSPSQVSQPSQVSYPSQVSAPSGVSHPSAVGAAPWSAAAPPAASGNSQLKLVAIVVAITALLGLVGIALIVMLRTRGDAPVADTAADTPAAAAAAAPPAATAELTAPAEPAPAEPAPAEPSPAEPAPSEPVAAAEPEPAASDPPQPKVTTKPAPATTTKPSGAGTTKPGATGAGKKPGGCDSPFFIDDKGIKHVKPECM